MSRRQAREKALQTIFQIDMGGVEPKTALNNILEEFGAVKADTKPFLENLVFGTLKELASIDEVISKVALSWNIERMANVDRNILRLALYEIYFMDDVPVNVSLNEAIELAKTYGDAESGKFVNGILGRIAAEQEKYNPVKQETEVKV